MELAFTLRGLRGSANVDVEINVDPVALGCDATARGFPVCTATVAYEGCGYAAMLGWIQLVRSTDGASGGRAFEIDPFAPLGRTPHPFCWFGLNPTLFDAPSRESLADLDWCAESFLAFIGASREARAVLGFEWGFAISDGEITVRRAAAVPGSAWDQHLTVLRAAHPSWSFAPGYRGG